MVHDKAGLVQRQDQIARDTRVILDQQDFHRTGLT
jgi:hypothetical protein